MKILKNSFTVWLIDFHQIFVSKEFRRLLQGQLLHYGVLKIFK